MALNLNTLKTRSLTAVIFVLVLLSCVYFSFYTFISFFFLVALMALNEFYNLGEKLSIRSYKIIGLIIGAILFPLIFFVTSGSIIQLKINRIILAFIALIPFLSAALYLFYKKKYTHRSLLFTLLGIVYCVLPFSLLVCIPVNSDNNSIASTAESYNAFKILGIVFLIWANDTFAYLGGSLIGKNKLYERVSPGKTWEGTIIGVIMCVGVGFVLNLNSTFNSNMVWPSIALLVGVLGTVGDLVESQIKRQAGVKDSGTLMPGHGGILDRFDSLLFVSPFVFTILSLLE